MKKSNCLDPNNYANPPRIKRGSTINQNEKEAPPTPRPRPHPCGSFIRCCFLFLFFYREAPPTGAGRQANSIRFLLSVPPFLPLGAGRGWSLAISLQHKAKPHKTKTADCPGLLWECAARRGAHSWGAPWLTIIPSLWGGLVRRDRWMAVCLMMGPDDSCIQPDLRKQLPWKWGGGSGSQSSLICLNWILISACSCIDPTKASPTTA